MTVIFSAEAITTAVAVAIHAAPLAVTITKTIAVNNAIIPFFGITQTDIIYEEKNK